MKNYFLICLFLFTNVVLYAQNNLIISLDYKSVDQEFFIDSKLESINLPLINLTRYKKYNDFVKKNYIGIPINDSISYNICFENKSIFLDLYKYGDISIEKLNELISERNIDTLNFSKINNNPTLIGVVGFFKNKQFIILDTNKNFDFSDDIKYEYDINLSRNPYENLDILKKQVITNYSYQDTNNGKIINHNRRFIIYPDKNNPYSISFSDNPNKDSEYFSIMKFRDYWKGNITHNEKEYEINYFGFSNKNGMLYVIPKEEKYLMNNSMFEENYKYNYYADKKFNDTIILNKERFIIDSISVDISKMYLKNIGKINHQGSRKGSYVGNLEFENLKGEKFKLNDILDKKKFTLLDFWGTWCEPCLEMTTKLKILQKQYLSKLNIVSIAVDNEKKNVIKYINEKQLNWSNAYISKHKYWNNLIIKKLKINYFPTFILLDSKGEIVLKGGSDSFDEIINLIK